MLLINMVNRHADVDYLLCIAVLGLVGYLDMCCATVLQRVPREYAMRIFSTCVSGSQRFTTDSTISYSIIQCQPTRHLASAFT